MHFGFALIEFIEKNSTFMTPTCPNEMNIFLQYMQKKLCVDHRNGIVSNKQSLI